MQRSQIVALCLGTGIAVAGGIFAAWQGWLPGVPALKPHVASVTPSPAKTTSPVPAAVQKAPVVPEKTEAPASPPVSASMQHAEAPAAIAPAPTAKPQEKPQEIATLPTPKHIAPEPKAQEKPQPIIPEFDTVRVEPSGDTVVAGHGAPGAKIELLAGDKVIGRADAGDSGDFVIVPQALAPGNYLLALRSRSGNEVAVNSRQTITVSVPEKGQKGVVVALTEPGKASVLLDDPTAKAKTPPTEAATKPVKPAAPAPAVAFKTAEVGKGAFYTTGMAAPGTHLRIYLNGSRLADVTADAAGHWSMAVKKGVVPGHYAVRADAINTSGKVVARAQVPFDMPGTVAEAKAVPKPEAVAAKPVPPAVAAKPVKEAEAKTPMPATPADAVVAEIGTATVQRGDSLWRISRKVFGQGIRYTLIYAANASQIRDPNLIYPGQVFVLPHASERADGGRG